MSSLVGSRDGRGEMDMVRPVWWAHMMGEVRWIWCIQSGGLT